MVRSLTWLAAGALAAGMSSPSVAAVSVTDDPVLFWNDLAASLVVGPPPAQARIMAIMNAAMHDAVSSTYNGASITYNKGVVAPGGNTRAAASTAAHDVLIALNPANAAAYDTALASSLALVSSSTAKSNGIATGAAYASAMLTARATDGSATVVTYTPSLDPGKWRPTPLAFAPASLPQWGGVTPFLMQAGDQFRPGPPPAINSAEYTAAYNEVKEIGSADSLTRLPDQTASALFWDASNGMTWFRIATDLVADDGNSTLQNARLFAKLSAAVADAFIAGFDSKYQYNYWRPISAIREGDMDGNDDTVGDASWNSLFPTPPHPTYASTHSLQSGAASVVLRDLLPDQSFCHTLGGDSRCFTSLGQAAEDAAYSRLWGGIHFRFDTEVGLGMGQSIGQWALEQDTFNAVPEPATWMMMIAGFGLVGFTMRRRSRQMHVTA